MSRRIQVLEQQLAPYNKVQTKYVDEMKQTVARMTAPGKGLLAADESVGSVTARFKGIGLANTAENRRLYRVLFLGAEGIERYISGVIFHDETMGQKMDDGTPIPDFCVSLGIVPGIKTDLGLAPLQIGAPGEEMTQGLDNYLKRAQAYYARGARFCKWRNTYKIQNGTVSEALVNFNAQTLARYAALSQIAGLVPIVEPEVMIDGNHTLEQSLAVSVRVWTAVAAALHQHGVLLECMLLKPNMIVPGADSGVKASPEAVGNATVVALARSFPPAIPGVTFLSGGLSEVQASEYLNAMNNSRAAPRPWNLSFSYARALQSSALKAWAGNQANFPKARQVFLHRARMNSQAQLGRYQRSEDTQKSESLYVKGHTY